MFMRQGWLKAPQKCKQMLFFCQKDEEEMVPDWKHTSPAKWREVDKGMDLEYPGTRKFGSAMPATAWWVVWRQ